MRIPKAQELGDALNIVEAETYEWDARNNNEWMNQRIYHHVIWRIKEDLLYLEGPNQKLTAEINYFKSQINLAERDLKEYRKEKIQVENEFTGLLEWFSDKTKKVQLVADREKKEAKETKKYKGVFKMEIIKKQEEEKKSELKKKRRENLIEERK